MSLNTKKYWQISVLLSMKKRWYLVIAPECYQWFLKASGALLGIENVVLNWPRTPPAFQYEDVPVSGVPDVAEAYFKSLIVSERLRAVFEAEVPDALAYHPVRIQGPGSDKLSPYFAVQFLDVWDCLHPYSWDTDEKGRYLAFPLIDAEKIPDGGLIGSVKHFEVMWLIHDSLKRKLKKAGITGFDFFMRAPFLAPDGVAPFEHVNHPRKPNGPGGGAIDSAATYPKPKLPRSSHSNRKKPK